MDHKNELKHLEHCVELAKTALKAGDLPFGSILVNAKNEVIATARNRVNEKNALAHPEFELAQWALENLTEEQRKQTTMYTSGEHCPMCAAAHGWACIGGLVYLSSAKQLSSWLVEFNVPEAPIQFTPVQQILKNVSVKQVQTPELLEQIKALHQSFYK